MATLGGVRDSQEGGSSQNNSVEIEDLARFAVQEHNKKENAVLEFVRVVKAQQQVVAGTLHHLRIEAVDNNDKKVYEAKVLVKPWINFKELHDFNHVVDDNQDSQSLTFTPSDLGVKKDGHGEGWKSVGAHDPQVQDAANHAVNTLQQRSNSLFPYQLQEVTHAKAQVIEDFAKFNMVLKVKRGDKEEKFKVEVHKNNEGNFNLNQMEQHES